MGEPLQNRSRTKQDDSVMETNSSCIVSKRSVEKFYLGNNPDFTKYFVKKLQRRSPLINRGYWLRMKAIDHVTCCFLAQSSPSQPKAIVNLGCGFDSSPFKHLYTSQLRGGPITENVIFVDIDYPKLMRRKCEIIQDTVALHGLLHGAAFNSASPGILLQSHEYKAVACDLTDTQMLEKVLRRDLSLQYHEILFIAEVSLTYVEAGQANDIIKLAATFDKSKFCLLEQCLVDGPDHPFASTMLHHFKKLQSPLQAIERYPTMEDQRRRFQENGWAHVNARSLWSVWNDDKWVTPNERLHVDRVEPFDEWEEFALFASHYFVLEAYSLALTPASSNLSNPEEKSGISPGRPGTVTLKVNFRESKSLRKQGAAFLATRKRVIHHGGQNTQGREGDYDVFNYALTDSANEEQLMGLETNQDHFLMNVPRLPITCHTITLTTHSEQLLVGGRSSPNQPSSSCFSLNKDGWNREASLPRGLFRHSTISLHGDPFGFLPEGVVVFGGKWTSTDLSDEWLYWSKATGWRRVEVIGSKPAARFGASMVRDRRDIRTDDHDLSGFLTGGIGAHGKIIKDFWKWTIYTENGQIFVQCKDISKELNISHDDNNGTKSFWRYGAHLGCLPRHLVLMGGISSSGTIPMDEELLLIGESFKITTISMLESWNPRPLLTGFGVAQTSNKHLLVMGGGATCFSFGSFWNKGCFNFEITEVHQPKCGDIYEFSQRGIPLNVPLRLESKQQAISSNGGDMNELPSSKAGPSLNDILRIKIRNKDDFHTILNNKMPVIMEDLYLGSCTKQWNLDYLRTRVGRDRQVVVHDSSYTRMNFLEKNFVYSTRTFGEFLEAIEQGHLLYLRSVSSTKPADQAANLALDFPTLANDFQLPPELEFASTNMHSSPLRISGPVAMWLHYDVMANVLCQIRGEKRIILFPPSEVAKLKFPPGASSSQLDVLPLFDSETPASTKQVPGIASVRGYVASLKPGDVLFIPPLWPHSAMPTEGISIAVNVFFRDMANGSYAAGKDVYGNRDLQAYENGRKDLARIVKPFNGLPDEVRHFYLTRLADELAHLASSCTVD